MTGEKVIIEAKHLEPASPAPVRKFSAPRAGLILGHLPQFARNPLEFLERCAKYHGDVVPLRFLHRRVLLLNHPDHIEQVLTAQSKHFRKTIGYRTPFMRSLFGQGLLTSEGTLWTQQRRLAQPAFHRDRIAGYANIIVQFAHETLSNWRAGERIDIHAAVMKLTTRVIVRTLFNAEVPPAIAQLNDASEVVLREFSQQYRLWRFIRILFADKGSRRFKEVLGEIDSFIYRLIDERRSTGENPGDLLSMLLAARDESGAGMSDRQLRDELVTLMVAGLDTTALAVSWSMFLLAKSPAAQTKIRAEIKQVLGGRPPTFTDLPQLRFTDAVLKESMRLYPPAWIVGREALSECQIGGMTIRPGTSVIMSQWLKHRDPRYFSDPLAFRPERWLDDSAKALPKFAYFPFGGGPRVCIGNTFAQMESSLTLACILQQFGFSCAPNYDVPLWPSITLQPQGGIWLQLEA